ncbi:MAG: MerR family DNA-binding transcriptional regulator, partial [Spirochaetota bacterium]|nr:MerR family DNA-binding transcriptional regulator [Spirochaetota bacterium]
MEEITVDELATLSGVTARTLRPADEIGLLKPARVAASGYRLYGQDEVDLL